MRKSNFFRTIVGAVAASLALSTAALANEEGIMPIAVDEPTLTVNETLIESPEMLFENGSYMIPLRKVCETLGLTVNWDAETNMITIEKLPVYITCYPNMDGYTFARTAPIFLGEAPILIEGTTYVPLNFIDKILQGKSEIDGINIKVTYGEEKVPEVAEKVTADTIYTNTIEGGIEVYDLERGTVEVNITEETKIFDAQGKEIKAEELAAGSKLAVVYGDTMTMSLPPIANAVEIKVVGDTMYRVVENTVAEIVKEEEKVVGIALGGEEIELVLNVTDELVVMDAQGNVTDVNAIKEGAKITAVAGMATTRSLPPQSAVYFIRIG